MAAESIFGKFVSWIDKSLETNDVELMTLKGHLMVEDALKFLLAAKLRPRKDPEEFAPKIDIRSFPALACLALIDEPDGTGLLDAVLALNTARNKVSHWIDHPAFVNYLESFVAKMRALKDDPHSWPDEPENQLVLVRRALDRATSRILHNGIVHHDGPPPEHITTREWESI